MELKGIN